MNSYAYGAEPRTDPCCPGAGLMKEGWGVGVEDFNPQVPEQ